jgi:hypothetical protein
MNREWILCAAIWYKELELKEQFNILPINCDKGVVFCGHRHYNCMYMMRGLTGKRSVESEVGKYIQGFLTSQNRFVDRTEAAEIAIRENQLIVPYLMKVLYSEDLY